VAWQDLSQIENLSDYDRVIINLSSLPSGAKPVVFAGPEIDTLFKLSSWVHILSSGGEIVVLGDPHSTVMLHAFVGGTQPLMRAGLSLPNPLAKPPLEQHSPLLSLLKIVKDVRPLEYRRVKRDGEGKFPLIYEYLDGVTEWKYSISSCLLEEKWHLGANVSTLGITTFSTALAATFEFYVNGIQRGRLMLLPPTGKDPETEDTFVFRRFFGITADVPEPKWVQTLCVPGQAEIQKQIAASHGALAEIHKRIAADEDRLDACKRWYRLLYDDGGSLEIIVKESFELLDASVTKTSKVKDDYRVKVPGFVEGVMEVKGTHNAQFAKGALRQLAGWMDEAIAQDNIPVKGIFVGNSARNDEPQSRGKLFEKNNEDYAVVKEIVIVRSMDLFCLSILKQLDLLDTATFWREFYGCKGSLDATKYWERLPKDFQIPSVELQP